MSTLGRKTIQLLELKPPWLNNTQQDFEKFKALLTHILKTTPSEQTFDKSDFYGESLTKYLSNDVEEICSVEYTSTKHRLTYTYSPNTYTTSVTFSRLPEDGEKFIVSFYQKVDDLKTGGWYAYITLQDNIIKKLIKTAKSLKK